MAVTIKDIAAVVGVSYSTVAKALKGNPLIKPETKRRILETAKQLGYQPNLAARSLVSRKSGTIGLVWPTVEKNVMSALITLINEQLERYGYSMIVSINPIQEALTLFSRLQVDGAIIVGESQRSSRADRASAISFPMISIGQSLYPGSLVIDIHRKDAIRLAVNYLAGIGHRKISYIGEITDAGYAQQEKLMGFYEGMMENGFDIHSQMAVNAKGLDRMAGYEAAKQLLQSSELPTAIISGSFELTTGIIRAVHEADLHIPDDISLVSYDHIPHMESLDVPVTAVGPPIQEMATHAVDWMVNMLKNPESVSPVLTLSVEIAERASCRTLNKS